MMASRSEPGFAPKRAVISTYGGKNKLRSLKTPAPDAKEALARSATTPSTEYTGAGPRNDDVAARRSAFPYQTGGSDKAPEKDTKRNVPPTIFKPAANSRSRAELRQPEMADVAPSNVLRPAKRKPIQQPTARALKKQRSSSPDVFEFPPSSPPRMPSTSARPSLAKVMRPLDSGKGRPAGSQPRPKPDVAMDKLKSTKLAINTAQPPRPLVRSPQRLPAGSRPRPPTALIEEEASFVAKSDSAPAKSKPPSSNPAVQPTPTPNSAFATELAPSSSTSTRPTLEQSRTSKPPFAQESALSRPPPARSSASIKAKFAASRTSSRPLPLPSTPPTRRPRLIDALDAQAEESPPSSPLSPPASVLAVERVPMVEVSSPAPIGTPSERPIPPSLARQASMNRKPGIKHTYSQQLTVLADEAQLGGVDPDDAENLAFSQPLLAPSLSNVSTALDFDDGLVEDPSTSGAVRSIHELRQAGANNRFADEMDDILDRIGTPNAKPSSIRRNALLETAQKIQERTFRRQFCSHHNGTSSLLRGLGNETDPIAGTLVLAILVTLLGTHASLNLAQQLPMADIARLAALLLPLQTEVGALAKSRASNMSKFAQTNLTGVITKVQQLDIWEQPLAPRLSPHTLALKCMQLIMNQSKDLGDLDGLFSAEVTDALFDVLSSAVQERDSACWEFPARPESTPLALALTLLEAYSIRATHARSVVPWSGRHLSTVADLLENALKHEPQRLGILETLVVKLTLNTANHNQEACTIYLKRGLTRELARVLADVFDLAVQSIKDGSPIASVLDSLLLMLGIMINCLEYGKFDAAILDGHAPYDQLVRFFLDNRSRTSEADSEEKSTLNVAFGYLSAVLGYLCRHEPVRSRFKTLHAGGNMEPLIDSIREFADFLRKANDVELSGFVNRLQIVLHELESFR